MNHSIYSADRATHFRIVVVALLVATVVAGLAVSLRTCSGATSVERVVALKLGKPVLVGDSNIIVAR